MFEELERLSCEARKDLDTAYLQLQRPGSAKLLWTHLTAAERKRPAIVVALLALAVIANIGAAIACFCCSQQITSRLEEVFLGSPPWLFGVIGGLFALNVLLVAVVWGWQKWGLVALVLVPLVQAGVLVAGKVDPLFAGVFLGATIVPPVVLFGAAYKLGSPSLWSQME